MYEFYCLIDSYTKGDVPPTTQRPFCSPAFHKTSLAQLPRLHSEQYRVASAFNAFSVGFIPARVLYGRLPALGTSRSIPLEMAGAKKNGELYPQYNWVCTIGCAINRGTYDSCCNVFGCSRPFWLPVYLLNEQVSCSVVCKCICLLLWCVWHVSVCVTCECVCGMW